MKRNYITLLLMLISISMFAVPAKRNLTRTIPVSDGTTVNARLVGDEHGHFCWQTMASPISSSMIMIITRRWMPRL